MIATSPTDVQTICITILGLTFLIGLYKLIRKEMEG